MGEFELISRFFSSKTNRADVLLGVGDDAALLRIAEGATVGCALVALSEFDDPRFIRDGRRFANLLGCSGLNRLAAAGGTTAWATLALSLPKPDKGWLEEFSAELSRLLAPFGAELVGGDTTRGPLTATLVAHGTCRDPQAVAARRPRAGDRIYLTGQIGRVLSMDFEDFQSTRPELALVSPRVEAGIAAADYVCAAADLSLSLGATLVALLHPHGLGAILDPACLPVADAAAALLERAGGTKLLVETARDPELCLLAAPDQAPQLTAALSATATPWALIGAVADEPGVRLA